MRAASNLRLFIFLNANARKPPQASELLTCTAQPATGANSRAAKKVFEVTARADVAAPLLEWSARALEFAYVHARGAAAEVTTQSLTMR